MEMIAKEIALACLRLHAKVFSQHLAQEHGDDATDLNAAVYHMACAFHATMVAGAIESCKREGVTEEEIILILTEYSILEKLTEIKGSVSRA